ncbi:hypothetical protein [Undibacter mobilis]|uniref:Peptide chain release factor 1 n=1 Tax=Undibacter mobilis TaxID=2292256 RepID=A0A371B8F7_9BRAD|nr:hypothetical protein [Undibacter mobilis]RDV03807.1 hypothetical protein DXH78_03925 [Undibacter mobilis]
MSKKSEDRVARFNTLVKERDELEAAIDGLIADMAEQPEAARRVGAWAADGASTQRYLTLTERLSEVEGDLVDLTRAMAAAADEGRPN